MMGIILPKHVERIISSINHCVASSWFSLFILIYIFKYNIFNVSSQFITIFLNILVVKDKRYVGFTLSQATKALRESRGIALLYF
jgi:hypothetical protein